jgi:hypothetical protein
MREQIRELLQMAEAERIERAEIRNLIAGEKNERRPVLQTLPHLPAAHQSNII